MGLAINLTGYRVAQWILVHHVMAAIYKVAEVYNTNGLLLVGLARIVCNPEFRRRRSELECPIESDLS
jgi:hypothetical protein